MKKMKIIFGITGIGNGHFNRQLPIIEHFVKKHSVTVFAYDQSLVAAKKMFGNNKNVTIREVAVPFYVGTGKGLDFDAMTKHPYNHKMNFFKHNLKLFAATQKHIGKPDLVITDYEPMSAKYAYLYDAPLVTLDQQHKYVGGVFPKSLAGFTVQDEIERLRLFFPKANDRIAVSFFKVSPKPGSQKVKIYPPIIKNAILNLKTKQQMGNRSVLVYISSARPFSQSISSIFSSLKSMPNVTFHLFVSADQARQVDQTMRNNVHVYPHGDRRFYDALSSCSGIICTAGHSLISEAMFLKIPVFALPVAPYEQHMNAQVIRKNGFGVSALSVSKSKLKTFVGGLDGYRKNIIKNKNSALIKGVGQNKIIDFLEKKYLS